MMVYLDTSAILAVLDADDQYHNVAKTQWKSLLHSDTILVCSNYILVETYALVQRRLGMGAVRLLSTDIEPIVRVIWVDEQTHRRGEAAVIAAQRKELSLVDCVSFVVMRQAGIREAFTFDRHFAEQGFTCLPGGLPSTQQE
ncbi:type II toxin-antitoxin system VapC family toxin [Candidatus Desulforudis audaxviator]|uniref:Ribonuclease VapC n=1 Tax=Desulforudis audaxviator (strain MP104C) TaxID=477974 RepID=B1I212_DESAP|nr:PIN domain-containing protein [Candidatus Desulforudis audaxviator]ACA58963.1 PilT protein domain protein [Candidatus Desulforudis audaxviator MP104C]AZK58998.1 Membrane-associated protein containing RNA-binding TRAM domain and ribonuclease PIN-domain [Candidatus Desulforudis audaxviator]